MIKTWILSLFLGTALIGSTFDQLDPKYCYSYGPEDAPIQVTEYFSLSCPKCLELFKRDFPQIKADYIDTGLVRWTFHPDPTDKLTLEAMIYSAQLLDAQKRTLLEGILTHLTPQSFANGEYLLSQGAAYFGLIAVPPNDLEYLQTTEAFKAAYAFLKQDLPIKDVPTISINGTIYDEMPTYAFLQAKLEELMKESS